MNEHNLPPDELASAFLDDELAESAADAVRRDPELAARASALRRAADAVGETVTPPSGAADAAVEAALADFGARQKVSLYEARRRRGLSVITGVAAAVAVGFIVAAAVGLFSESDDGDADTQAAPALSSAEAPAPAPAPEPAPAEAPPPADMAPGLPTAAELDLIEAVAAEALEAAQAAQAAAELAQATAEGNQEAVAAAEAALAEAQAAADAARAEASAAQSEADAAREAASAAQVEAAAAQAEPSAAQAERSAAVAEPPPPATSPPPAAPPPPAATEETAAGDVQPADDMAADDMEDMEDMAADPSAGGCDAAIGDGTVELQITADETRVLIVRTPDGRPTALDGATCAEIPPDEPTDISTDPQPDDCAAAVGDGTVELQITAGETRVLIVRTPDGRPTALDGATCSEIAPTEPG